MRIAATSMYRNEKSVAATMRMSGAWRNGGNRVEDVADWWRIVRNAPVVAGHGILDTWRQMRHFDGQGGRQLLSFCGECLKTNVYY